MDVRNVTHCHVSRYSSRDLWQHNADKRFPGFVAYSMIFKCLNLANLGYQNMITLPASIKNHSKKRI